MPAKIKRGIRDGYKIYQLQYYLIIQVPSSNYLGTGTYLQTGLQPVAGGAVSPLRSRAKRSSLYLL